MRASPRYASCSWTTGTILRQDAEWEDAAATEGCAIWAATYDSGFNPLIDLDNSVLSPILTGYPPGDALDAACGTGRWADFPSRRGHVVHGIDESLAMLEIARAKVPGARFDLGDLRSLPLPNQSIDLVVCSLALSYLPHLDEREGHQAGPSNSGFLACDT